MQISWIRKGLKTGVLTTCYPTSPETMPPGFRGRIVLDPAGCRADPVCDDCVRICPTRALTLERDAKGDPVRLRLDLGACIGCGLCVDICSEGAITVGPEYETATRRREDLWTDLVYDLGMYQEVIDNSGDTPDHARRGKAPSGLPQGEGYGSEE